MRTEDFYDLHHGETCMIVGGGPNLKLTPPEIFDYPSFGCNTIFRYKGWKPTYYVGVDERLRVENGAEILKAYPEIPKFFPTPDWDGFDGPNIYRFKHGEGGGLYIGGWLPNNPDALTKRGILYYKIMGAVIQIAWHMGFEIMLMIGIEHNPEAPTRHFWGDDTRAQKGEALDLWFEEYAQWSRAMGSQAKLLNISKDTYVPEWAIKRDDYRNWITKGREK